MIAQRHDGRGKWRRRKVITRRELSARCNELTAKRFHQEDCSYVLRSSVGLIGGVQRNLLGATLVDSFKSGDQRKLKF